MDRDRTQRVYWMASWGYGITGLMGLRMSFLQKKGKPRALVRASFGFKKRLSGKEIENKVVRDREEKRSF